MVRRSGKSLPENDLYAKTIHLHLDSNIWAIEIIHENSAYPPLPERLWHPNG